MISKQLLFSQFNEEVTNYNESFLDYCMTFEIDLFCEEFFEEPSCRKLNSTSKVKQELFSFFKPLKEELLTYQYDYYSHKSVEYIAKKINVDTSRVVAYIERNKHTFSNVKILKLSEFGDVTPETLVKNISSFKILKEFQLIERQLLVSNLTKERLRLQSKSKNK